MRRVREVDARSAICRECGQLWYIATMAVIPREGYICPWCRAPKKQKQRQAYGQGRKNNANGCR